MILKASSSPQGSVFFFSLFLIIIVAIVFLACVTSNHTALFVFVLVTGGSIYPTES